MFDPVCYGLDYRCGLHVIQQGMAWFKSPALEGAPAVFQAP